MARTLTRALMGVLIAACASPAAAAAGGWATVGLEPMPDRVGPGEPWVVNLTVLQHGVTPLEGVRPTLTIQGAGEASRTFKAVATGQPGIYRARVVFPSAGSWRYTVDDDFSAVHRFGPVRIAQGTAAPAASTAAGGESGGEAQPGSGVSAGAVAGLVAAGALLLGLLAAWARGRVRPAAG